MASATVSAETGSRQFFNAVSNSPSYPSRRSISAIAARAKSSTVAPGRRAFCVSSWAGRQKGQRP